MTEAATDAIVRAAQLKVGMNILDVATGIGDPAITLAMLVTPDGHVTAVDMVEEMLEAAEVAANQQELTNISFQRANAESLPFPDQSFDVVTCKHAVMLFADVEGALREIWRVLKPGGCAIFTAQGLPEENPWQSCIVETFGKYIRIPEPELGTPNVHRFAHSGTLSAVLRGAGFSNIWEESPILPWIWYGTPEEYWESRRSQGALFPRLIERLVPEQRADVVAEVIESIRQHYDGQRLNFTARIVIASGNR